MTLAMWSRWETGARQVPPARVLDVERITGISRHELRADVFGPPPWREIPVKNAGFAKVDAADFELVASRKWYAVTRRGITYAECCTPVQQMMHRLVMGDAPKGMVVDHINGDPLDNRRVNLRFCTQSENSKNRVGVSSNPSGFKGVSWKSGCGKWRARLMVNRQELALGLFDRAEDAARAYDAAAKEHFGEFAKLNFGPAKQGEAA